MVPLKISVIKFARMSGISPLINPYTIQKMIPILNKIYMFREIPSVFRVIMTRTACGTNDVVVKNAAI